MCHAQSAVSFILDHGHHAAMTADGVQATSLVGRVSVSDREDDEWFEEVTVFPVDDCGHVALDDVRTWLGY